MNVNGSEVKLSGDGQTMTGEEFRIFINKYKTSVKDMTPEQKQDRIHELESAIRKLKVITFAVHLSLQDDLAAAEESRRIELEKRDRQYKPRPVADEQRESKTTVRKERVNTAEAAIRLYMGYGMSREEAERKVLALQSQVQNGGKTE